MLHFLDWKNVFELIPVKFKKTTNLKRTGITGIFAASLELSREGIIKIMQGLGVMLGVNPSGFALGALGLVFLFLSVKNYIRRGSA